MPGQHSNAADGKKAPFRGLLENMASTRAMKVEMGMLDATQEITEIVRDARSGEIFAVTLKPLIRKEKAEKADKPAAAAK